MIYHKCNFAFFHLIFIFILVLLAFGGITTSGYSASVEVVGHPNCEIQALPTGRYGHSGITLPDMTPLICGGSDGSSVFSSCLMYNMSDNRWSTHSTMSYSSLHSSNIVMTGVYMLGGSYGKSKFEYLPSSSDSWISLSDIPGAGVDASCVAQWDKDSFVIIGGQYDRKQVRQYTVSTATWQSWPDLTVGLRNHDCIKVSDTIVVAGGQWDGSTSDRTLIMTGPGEYREGGRLGTARHGHQMGKVGDTVLAVGGYGGYYLTSVEEWNQVTEKWTVTDMTLITERGHFALLSVPLPSVCGSSGG